MTSCPGHDPKYERHLLVHGRGDVAEWLVPARYVMVDRIESKREGRNRLLVQQRVCPFLR